MSYHREEIMTQTELIWVLISIVQIGIVSFVGYWTRRVTKLEDTLSGMVEARTDFLFEYQGRMSRVEAQFAEICKSLARIERSLENHITEERKEG